MSSRYVVEDGKCASCRRLKSYLGIVVALLWCCFAAAQTVNGNVITFPVDVRGAYTFTNTNPGADQPPDIPDSPLIINLAQSGITPGTVISGISVGDMNFCGLPGETCNEVFGAQLCGVFSSSNTLLASGGETINRVPGAIAPDFTTATSCATHPTLFGSISTDIPQDFVFGGEHVTVPSGAAYLMVEVNDSFYSDNTDPNADFGLALTIVAPATQTVTLTYSPSASPETQIATVGRPTDPSAQSLALTVNSVINPLTVNVEFHYEATDVSSGAAGVGTADGVCEVSQGATEQTDFDCRLADGGFVYQTLANGDQAVPHIIPSHNNFGVWVRVIATLVSNGQPAVAGTDYIGPVEWYYAWNTNPPLIPSPILEAPVSAASTTNFVNPEYAPGWNNLNPQFFDRHGDDPDIAFKFNITAYAKFNCNPTCVGTADPGIGGKTPTFNDVVAADIPNPPAGQVDVVEPLVPVPGISPFPYVGGMPMLVAFELEKTGTEIPDATALTLPHNVSAAVLDPATGLPVPVPTFPGFPKTFTYNPFFKLYYIFLSPRPLTPGKIYQLQINSDLFPRAVNTNIVVRKGPFF